MSYTVYEEDILYTVKDYLADNLGAVLAGIKAEQVDGIDLPDVKKYEVGDFDIYALNQYPACLIFPSELDFEPLSVGADNLKVEAVLRFAIRGGKTENLTLKVLRYAAACRQAIDADRTLGAEVDRASVVKVNFYARLSGQEDKAVVDVVLNLEKEIPR
jgi:hypothetical protein